MEELESLWEKVQLLSFTAGMNQRYYMEEMQRSTSSDSKVRMWVGILAIVSLVLTCIYYKSKKPPADIKKRHWSVRYGYQLWSILTYDRVSILVGVLSMGIAWQLNVSPLETDVVYNSDMYRRWSDLRMETDRLMTHLERTSEGAVPPGAEDRFTELLERKNLNNSLERRVDEDLLDKCFKLEETARANTRDREDREHSDQAAAVSATPVMASR